MSKISELLNRAVEGFYKTMDTLQEHIAKRDNPHGVTKEQIGLGNVQNVKAASADSFDSHKKAAVLDHPDGSVTEQKLASGAVTAPKIQNGAVTPEKIYGNLPIEKGGTGADTPEGAREESALEESLKGELANCTLESEPQQLKHLYSNLGIRLASLIAQQKTGEYYSALAKKYVLNPLGMTKTTFDLRDAATYPLSLPHTAEDNGFEVEHHIKENAARLAAGGLYSNTDDLSRLARCILNGGKADNGKEIVSQKTLDEMINHKWNYIKTGKDSCYGLTMTIKEYKDGFLAGHLGNAAPYGAGFFCDIKKGYGAIVLMNTFNSDLRYEIPKMIMEML